MLIYKNISKVTKTFHGVTFRPGEVKQVSDYINDKFFVRQASMPQEPPKRVEPKNVTKVNDKPKQEPKAGESKDKPSVDNKLPVTQESINET